MVPSATELVRHFPAAPVHFASALCLINFLGGPLAWFHGNGWLVASTIDPICDGSMLYPSGPQALLTIPDFGLPAWENNDGRHISFATSRKPQFAENSGGTL